LLFSILPSLALSVVDRVRARGVVRIHWVSITSALNGSCIMHGSFHIARGSIGRRSAAVVSAIPLLALTLAVVNWVRVREGWRVHWVSRVFNNIPSALNWSCIMHRSFHIARGSVGRRSTAVVGAIPLLALTLAVVNWVRVREGWRVHWVSRVFINVASALNWSGITHGGSHAAGGNLCLLRLCCGDSLSRRDCSFHATWCTCTTSAITAAAETAIIIIAAAAAKILYVTMLKSSRSESQGSLQQSRSRKLKILCLMLRRRQPADYAGLYTGFVLMLRLKLATFACLLGVSVKTLGEVTDLWRRSSCLLSQAEHLS
jgi:hypothetical protein